MKPTFRGAVLSAVVMVCAGAFGLAAAPADPPGWDAKAAASYLDGRAEWWTTWPNAKRDRGTFCISCHTTLPYALARPALRGVLGEREPAAAEGKVLGNLLTRARNWRDVEPFYPDQTRGIPKTSESRAIEAVMNALVITRRDRASRGAAGSGALSDDGQTALGNMWALQMKTGPNAGAWTWLNFNYDPWESPNSTYYGASLAALAVGSAPAGYAKTPEIQDNLKALRGYFQREFEKQSVHNRLMGLWASAGVADLLTAEQRTTAIDGAFALQQTDGGWSTPALGGYKRGDNTPNDMRSDGYATALATLALQEAGVPKSDPRLAKGLEWLRRGQDRATGRWTATSVNKQRDPESDAGKFMSDAATALAVLSLTSGTPQAATAVAPESNQAPAPTGSWRPTIVAQHGMVAAGHPLAAEAGVRILKAGGNAIDAAIATWAVQGEVEPGMTGLGADMFILYYDAKSGEVKFINGTGYAAQAATIDFYKSKGGIPDEGPLSISVPGAVGGAAYAVKKYGTKPLADVLAPAIEIADGGFPITEALAGGLRSARAKLAKYPSSTKIWFKDGKPLEMGDIVKNPDLARTLRTIAAQGADPFYRGAIAKSTAAFLKANGGIISEADLADYAPFEDAPIHVNYRGTEVYECPPNSQGFVMLEALNILEGFNLKEMGRNSVPYLHAVTEALKLSFADRNAYVGDPKFVKNIPIAALLSKEYAAVRRSQIDPNRAIAGEPAPGDPARMKATAAGQQAYASPLPTPTRVQPFDPDEILNLTTYLAVVDKDHNMVSITSSLLSGFGSGVVVEGGGFLMNDRMRYFYLDPKNVNALEPRKRVRQTINPAMALKNGKPWIAFGTPGSDTQPQTQLQFFLNVAEFALNVQEALEQPTVISNSFQDSYQPHDVKGMLLTPAMLPQAIKDGLSAKGHKLDIRNVKGAGSVKAILIDPRTGVLMGGVSPTGDSYVVAW